MKSSTKLYKHILEQFFIMEQAYTLTIIMIIVIFSQAIIDIEKFQYRPCLHSSTNNYELGRALYHHLI